MTEVVAKPVKETFTLVHSSIDVATRAPREKFKFTPVDEVFRFTEGEGFCSRDKAGFVRLANTTVELLETRSREVVALEKTQVHFFEKAKQGPAGPAGVPGRDGTAAEQINFTALPSVDVVADSLPLNQYVSNKWLITFMDEVFLETEYVEVVVLNNGGVLRTYSMGRLGTRFPRTITVVNTGSAMELHVEHTHGRELAIHLLRLATAFN